MMGGGRQSSSRALEISGEAGQSLPAPSLKKQQPLTPLQADPPAPGPRVVSPPYPRSRSEPRRRRRTARTGNNRKGNEEKAGEGGVGKKEEEEKNRKKGTRTLTGGRKLHCLPRALAIGPTSTNGRVLGKFAVQVLHLALGSEAPASPELDSFPNVRVKRTPI